MKSKQMIGWAAAVFMGMAILCPSAKADVYMGGKGRQQMPTIKNVDDAVSNIPVLSRIPKSFIVGDGFKFKFTGMELQIDHMGMNSKAPVSKRTCMVGLSYTTPVAFFGSRVEIPIFHAQSLRMSDWGINTLGDYVAHFSKDAPVQHPVVGLSVSARF